MVPADELKPTKKAKPGRKKVGKTAKALKAKPKLKEKSPLYNSPAITLKYSDRRHSLFMDKLKESVSINVAAKAAGISRNTAYRWRHQVTNFADEWDDIISGKMEDLECDVYERATKGAIKDVYYRGEIVGQQREPSDQLAMFFLKANKPDVYDRANSITIEGEGEFTMTINDQNKEIADGT